MSVLRGDSHHVAGGYFQKRLKTVKKICSVWYRLVFYLIIQSHSFTNGFYCTSVFDQKIVDKTLLYIDHFCLGKSLKKGALVWDFTSLSSKLL